MSNRSERNRLKRKARIQKLLGYQYQVESYYGGFRAYKRKTLADLGSAYTIDFRPYGLEWHITSEKLSINWRGSPLRAGVKMIHATMLLVN